MHKWIHTLLLFFLFIPCTYAYQKIFEISYGIENANTRMHENIMILSPFKNTYYSRHVDHAQVIGLFTGLEFKRSNWPYQIGLSYRQNSAFDATGKIYQLMDPELSTLRYHFNVTSKRFALASKLFYAHYQRYLPYVSFSFGYAINRAYAYREVAQVDSSLPSLFPFKAKTKHAFTYSIGLGLQYLLTNSLRLGMNAEWTKLGQASLAPNNNQESTKAPSLHELWSSACLLQLSYLF